MWKLFMGPDRELHELSLIVLIIMLLAKECKRKGVSDSGVSCYFPLPPMLVQLQRWTWSPCPDPLVQLSPCRLQHHYSPDLWLGDSHSALAIHQREGDWDGIENFRKQCWKVTFSIVTWTQLVLSSHRIAQGQRSKCCPVTVEMDICQRKTLGTSQYCSALK